MRYIVVQVSSGVLEEGFSSSAPRPVYLVVDTTPATGYPIALARCDSDASAAAIRDALN